MEEFVDFKEKTDITETGKMNQTEISKEAQKYFEYLMGDENLPEEKKQTEKEETSWGDAEEKFEKLFETDSTSVRENEIEVVRELTDEEQGNLKEALEWKDKQISKCTIDEEGVIHYKTDCEYMEGKMGANEVMYERKTVDIYGIKVEGVFPVFESLCDIQLPEDFEKVSNAKQFKECNRQLKEQVRNNIELRDCFDKEQLEEIESNDTPTGYVWHHNEETGKMQLVKIEHHDRTQGGAAHTGGKALWGGGY